MARLNFDARNVAPDSGVQDAIPAGWYIAAVTASEMKPTNDGSGAYLEAVHTILDGQYKNRKVFARFNLRNNSEDAVRIAYGQLSALCHASGVLLCEDSQQLHGIPVKIKVSVRKGGPKKDKDTGQPTGETYEDSNDIKAWANVNDPTAGMPTGAAAAPAAAAPAATWGAAAPAAAPAWAPAGGAPGHGAPMGAPAGHAAGYGPAGAPGGAPAGGWQPSGAPTGAPAGQPAQPGGAAVPWAGAPGGAPGGAPTGAPGGAPAWAAGGPAAAPGAPAWAAGGAPGGAPAWATGGAPG